MCCDEIYVPSGVRGRALFKANHLGPSTGRWLTKPWQTQAVRIFHMFALDGVTLERPSFAGKPLAKLALWLRIVRKFTTAHSSVPSRVTIVPAKATRPAWIMGETSISAGAALLFVIGQNNVFLVGVDDEHRQQLCTLGCAGICTDFVTVAWGL